MAHNKRSKSKQDGFNAPDANYESGYNYERFNESRRVEGRDHSDIGNSSNTDRLGDRTSTTHTDAFGANQYQGNNNVPSHFIQQHQSPTTVDNTKTIDGYIWTYTTTSTGKQLNNYDDAKRYIHSLARIWKIDEESLEAQRFLATVENAVTDKKKDYAPEFIYQGKTNVVFVSVKVQPQKGEKCTIYHCLQLLQRRSSTDGISNSQTFAQMPSISFFRKNAEKSIATHGAVLGSAPLPLIYQPSFDSDRKEENTASSYSSPLCNTQ